MTVNYFFKYIKPNSGYDNLKNSYYFYVRDHLGNNRVVMNLSGDVVQSNEYYPFGGIMASSTESGKQPYKYGNKELDTQDGLNLYDFSARLQDPMIPTFTSIDPLAEKKPWVSPYIYCRNNPLRFIDPDGMDEWEKDEEGKWMKISDIGNKLGVNIYHTGVFDKNGKEISRLIDKDGNGINMTDGRSIFKNGEIRGNDVDYGTITDEYMNGQGPERSIFEGDHPANNAIQDHYLYQKASSNFESSGKDKELYKVDWSPLDVLKTGTSNGQAQMMGSYNISFYKLGDKTLSIAVDSKSKTSLGLHLPFTNTPRQKGQVYNPWAGTWTRPNNSFNTTHQVYIFFTK